MTTFLTLEVIDDDLDTKTIPIYMSGLAGTVTVSAINSAGSAVATALDAVIEGAIRKMRLVLDVPLPGGIKGSPVADSDVERGGLLRYALNGQVRRFSHTIPAFLGSLYSGDDIDVSLSSGPVFDWTSLIVGGTGVFIPTDEKGIDIVAVEFGRKNFRKRGARRGGI